jgi:hypothetical protein
MTAELLSFANTNNNIVSFRLRVKCLVRVLIETKSSEKLFMLCATNHFFLPYKKYGSNQGFNFIYIYTDH